jgi:hypothetical protein
MPRHTSLLNFLLIILPLSPTRLILDLSYSSTYCTNQELSVSWSIPREQITRRMRNQPIVSHRPIHEFKSRRWHISISSLEIEPATPVFRRFKNMCTLEHVIFIHKCTKGAIDNSVCRVGTLWLGVWGTKFRSLTGIKHVSLLQSVQIGPGPQPISYSMSTGGPFPEDTVTGWVSRLRMYGTMVPLHSIPPLCLPACCLKL